MAKYYYFGPWHWTGRQWQPPKGTVGSLDLRPFAACGQRGGIHPQNFGLFVTNEPLLDASYLLMGTDLDAALRAENRSAVGDALKTPALRAASVRELLPELLTTAADPANIDRPPPLLPKMNGELEVILGGERIWHRPFEGESDSAWPNIQVVLQENYRKIRSQALASGLETHRRVLGSWKRKYQMPEEHFIPRDLPPTIALVPKTSVSDDFNRGNEELGASANWTEVVGDWRVVSNEVSAPETGPSPGIPSSARYETALSSDDHYAQIDFNTAETTSSYMGAAVRFAAAATTFYHGVVLEFGSVRSLYKVVTNSQTQLDTDTNGGAPPHVVKVQIDGTTLKLFDDGVEALSVVDATISGSVRLGITAHDFATNESWGDDFEGADLVSWAGYSWGTVIG